MVTACPSCGAALPGGTGPCPACAAADEPRTEGALAAKPAPAVGQAKTEPLRQIPALRKERPGWKDEVRERVRHRKHRRTGEGDPLPLFEDADGPKTMSAEVSRELPPPIEQNPRGDEEKATPADDDLFLRSLDEPSPAPPSAFEGPTPLGRTRGIDAEPEEASEAESHDWSLGGLPSSEPRPVERPAHVGERLQAAAIDFGLFLLTSALVVYFASRAARVPLSGLRPTWPYLALYLLCLGIWYAGYFTGATGQTLGKLTTGLRVVDRQGAPPGYVRASLRAALGILGIAAALLGLVPILFDPARRAFHDRVFKTRVIRG